MKDCFRNDENVQKKPWTKIKDVIEQQPHYSGGLQIRLLEQECHSKLERFDVMIFNGLVFEHSVVAIAVVLTI